MLVLSRKRNEEIVIDGRITIKVIAVNGGTVRLGIDAPPELPIVRRELLAAQAARSVPRALPDRDAAPAVSVCEQVARHLAAH